MRFVSAWKSMPRAMPLKATISGANLFIFDSPRTSKVEAKAKTKAKELTA